MKIKYCAVFFMVCLSTQILYSVEIPLGLGGVPSASQGSRFGIVDIEEVLETFPETKKKESELRKYVEDINIQIKEMENAIQKIRLEVESADKQSSAAPAPVPERSIPREGFVVIGSDEPAEGMDEYDGPGGAGYETAVEPGLSAAAIEAKKKELESKIAELDSFRERSMRDVESSRRSFAQSVMGKIYAVVEEIAKEEGVQIIVDKNSVLYGKGEIDLTFKVMNRLSGRR